MSFILDALRKSESERQRDVVPNVMHIPLAPARLELPAWVVPVTSALGLAVVALAWAWWYSAGSADEPERPRGAEIAAARAPAAGPPPTSAAQAQAAAQDPAPRAGPADGPRGERGVVPLGELAGAPPREAAPPAGTRPRPAAAADDEVAAALPRASDLRAEGVALPPLTLELHVYSETPARRFVFVNGSRYAEGETLASGQDVVRITPEGVVLAHAGRRFLLLPQ